jgi:multiple sugar transport system permease protein
MMTKNNQEVENQKKSFREKAKERFQEIRREMKDPVEKAVRSQKRADRSGAFLRGFLLFGLSFIIVFPLFQDISLAIRDPSDLNNPLVNWIPEHFSLVNIKIAATLLNFWKSLLNNVKVSLISTIGTLFATSLAGYAFARLRFKGSNVIFLLFLLCLIVPPQAVALSQSLFFSNFDILGIFKAIFGHSLKLKGEGKDYVFYILSFTGQGIRASLFIFIFRQFFRGIPIDLEESAQMDGAGVIRTFWSVMLPNARGAITTVSLFAFVWQWNDVYYTKMYGISGDSFPLMTMKLINIAEWLSGLLKSPQFKYLSMLVGDDIRDNPLFTQIISNTAALLMMSPLLIAYIFVQRLFVEGIERTGLVG